MDELKKGLEISMKGKRAQEVIGRFRAQVDQWDIALPDVDPLVLDFGLGDFSRIGLIEYWIANEAKGGYCGKYLFVFDGQTCPLHRHKMKMETFFGVAGLCSMSFDGRDLSFARGDTLTVQPGVLHSFTGSGPCLLLELSSPCFVDDNYFENRRIPIGGNYDPGAR